MVIPRRAPETKYATQFAPRHAELAVNLAGTVAAFLVATWSEKAQKTMASR